MRGLGSDGGGRPNPEAFVAFRGPMSVHSPGGTLL